MQFKSQAILYDKIRTISDVTFDYYVRVRFDVGFVMKVESVNSFDPEALHTNLNHFPISDQFAIIPKGVAARYFEIMDSFYECVDDSSSNEFQLFNDSEFGQNEALLLTHLFAKKVKIQRHENLQFAIVREGKGAECGRLRSLSLDAAKNCVSFFGQQNVYSERGKDVGEKEKSYFNFNFKYVVQGERAKPARPFEHPQGQPHVIFEHPVGATTHRTRSEAKGIMPRRFAPLGAPILCTLVASLLVCSLT